MIRAPRSLFLAEEQTAEAGHYGCPMLKRTRFYPSKDSSQPAMRCNLGWAVHNEVEMARCMATDVLNDCWKVHPERTPVVTLVVDADVAEATGD